MSIVIIEIKARCSDHDAIRTVLHQHQARFVGEDRQVDTYFCVPEGRLKLREGRIENTLIYYQRANQEGPKRSDVDLFKTKPGTSLRTVLENALGVLTVVDKRREIYFVENVKVHLDHVEGLGAFVEIEAIDEEGTMGVETLQEQCDAYMAQFGITPEALVAVSYSDLLLEKEKERG